MRFKKFYYIVKIVKEDEDEHYVNVDDNEGKENLGVIDPEDVATKDEIKKSLNKKSIEDFLNIILKGKSEKLTKYFKFLRYLFLKYTKPGEYDKLKDIAEKITKKPFPILKVPKFTLDSLYNYYNLEGVIDKELFNKLTKYLGENEGQPTPGPGEFLLAIFTALDRSSTGDLTNKDGSLNIEVKGTGGIMKPASSHLTKGASEANKQLRKLTKLELKSGHTIGLGDLDKIFNFIKPNIENKKLIEEILSALINYKNTKADSTAYNLLKTRINNTIDFQAFALTLHMYAYSKNNKIDMFIFLNKYSGNALSFNTTGKSFEEFYNFVKENLRNKASWRDPKPGHAFTFK